METKGNALQLEFHPVSSMILCEQEEEEWWREADTYTASTRYWLRNVTYHNLDTYLNWKCLIENRISRHVWIKTYLRCSHNLPNAQLVFTNSKIKALWCITVRPSPLSDFSTVFNVCMVWLYTLSQSFALKNQLGLHIIKHWRSCALGFCRKLKLISSWGLGHPNPYHALFDCGNTPCLNTLVESVRYLITWLRYTLPHYSVELYPAFLLCCGILHLNTLLVSTQS